MDLRWLLEFLLEDVDHFVGGASTRDDRDTGQDPDEFLTDPSHVCQSCEEEYYVDAEMTIGTCRSCGGTKVEPS